MLLMASLLMSSCYNAVEDQFYSGNYETALRNSLEKINRSRKRDQYIDIARKAYDKSMADEKRMVASLKARNSDGSYWGEIYFLYLSMDEKQEAIAPYLPLRYNDGTIVDIELFDLNNVIEEARAGAADFHYGEARRLLHQGNRRSGREAYSHLQEIRRYFHWGRFSDEDDLLRYAADLGTNRVLIRFKTPRNQYVPDAYLEELAYFDYEGYVYNWTKLDREPIDSIRYDYAIDIILEQVRIDPGLTRQVHYDKTKEVEDGVQPLLDGNGQIVLDSTGNVIQVPRYTTLVCHVTEWSQQRTARVFTSFEIHDLRYNERRVYQRLEDHAVFENRYATANGHLQILPSETIALINNHPKPFPNDHDMLLLTAESIKRQVATAIRNNGTLLAAIR